MNATLAPFSFELPAALVADSPPEARGVGRDRVRLLVGDPQGVVETRFDRLGRSLNPGDLVVVNDSETRPAALSGARCGSALVVHLSAVLDDATWLIELRRLDQAGPDLGAQIGDQIDLPSAGTASLLEPFGDTRRLWRATLTLPEPIDEYLARHGHPIRYSYVPERWPLSDYTTMFAKADRTHFGSAEMPSAARPFSRRLVADLTRRGIRLARVTLHTGVSSLEAHEPPAPERFRVGEATAHAINEAKRNGGRVVAVGTSVVRALESVGTPDGAMAAQGWADLVLGADRPAQVVDGLITGWHPPEASHLGLLEAVVGRSLVETMYRTALDADFLWHEFGDSALMFR